MGLLHREEDSEFFGRVQHRNRYWLAQLRHNLVYDRIIEDSVELQETVAELGFAVAFAGKQWTIGPPVRHSFVLIDRHELWEDASVKVGGGSGLREELDSSLPLLADNLRPYYETDFILTVVDNFRLLEDNQVWVRPGYRRCGVYTLGSEAVYSVRGTLLGPSKEAISNAALLLLHEDGTEFRTFTNVAGRFVAGPLKPGKWVIQSVDRPLSYPIHLQGKEWLQSLGEVVLSDAAPVVATGSDDIRQ